MLVYRLDKLIYANRAFLDWTGYGALDMLEEAGGLDALFVEPSEDEQAQNNGLKSLTVYQAFSTPQETIFRCST